MIIDTPAVSTLRDFALFQGSRQYDNFWRISSLLPTVRLSAARRPFDFPTGAPLVLPDTYSWNGVNVATDDLLNETDTVALLILRDGEIVHEHYALTGGQHTPWLSMSVAKSFVSTLVGIALEEGCIGNIDDAISDYVPVHPNSAYDGVSIRHVLQMSSGARWTENYGDPDSDIARLSAASSGYTGHLDEFIANAVREFEPGTVCRYNSADTQVLGSLVRRATGRTLVDYLQEKLYEPLGMVDDGHWLVDARGVEMAYAGLNLTARDYAKLGELFRNRGIWNGQQLVSAAWVDAATHPETPVHEPGMPLVAGGRHRLGYGYQWWIPEGGRGDFVGIGVYNQFLYVDPRSGVTIVKLSANPRFGRSTDDADNRDFETVEFLQAIAKHLEPATQVEAL